MRYRTASTSPTRSGSSCPSGTRKGIFASTIFRFARTRRCAMVDSDCRNARAISAVVSPATDRSVSASCASRASAGWQQVKMSSSRSSGTDSSATSKSPRLRTSAAVSLPASSRKTAATASWVIVVASVLHDRTDLDVAGERLRDADRLVEVRHIDHRESSDVLLRFDEGPVEDLHRTVHAAHGGRGPLGLQLRAALEDAALLEVVRPARDLGVHGLDLFLRAITERLVVDEHEHVLRHRLIPLGSAGSQWRIRARSSPA